MHCARATIALPACVLLACTSAPPPSGFPAEPAQTLTSDQKDLIVEVRTSPEPATRGDQSVEYTITETASGAPVTGLRIDVVPWMPIMNHGTSIVPSVSETGPGVYVISNVDLFMTGEWQLRSTITAAVPAPDAGDGGAALTDHVGPIFQIP
jgi:hypothetical protein